MQSPKYATKRNIRTTKQNNGTKQRTNIKISNQTKQRDETTDQHQNKQPNKTTGRNNGPTSK
jgi:hypothetical protein